MVDCRKCKKYRDRLEGTHYYKCLRMKDKYGNEMYDLYDIRVLDPKYRCNKYDDIHANTTVERSIEEDDQSLPDKE